MLDKLVSDLSTHKSSFQRRNYIILCTEAVEVFPLPVFFEVFWGRFISLGKDLVTMVKLAYVMALPKVKPYIMSNLDRHHEMSETLNLLRDDMD